MKYPKVCKNCENCKNSPYGDWYCVDDKGKVLKEIKDTKTETCNKFRLAEIIKEYIKIQKKDK